MEAQAQRASNSFFRNPITWLINIIFGLYYDLKDSLQDRPQITKEDVSKDASYWKDIDKLRQDHRVYEYNMCLCGSGAQVFVAHGNMNEDDTFCTGCGSYLTRSAVSYHELIDLSGLSALDAMELVRTHIKPYGDLNREAFLLDWANDYKLFRENNNLGKVFLLRWRGGDTPAGLEIAGAVIRSADNLELGFLQPDRFGNYVRILGRLTGHLDEHVMLVFV